MGKQRITIDEQFLVYISQRPPLKLSDLGLKKGVLIRLLNTLKRKGFISVQVGGRYFGRDGKALWKVTPAGRQEARKLKYIFIRIKYIPMPLVDY